LIPRRNDGSYPISHPSGMSLTDIRPACILKPGSFRSLLLDHLFLRCQRRMYLIALLLKKLFQQHKGLGTVHIRHRMIQQDQVISFLFTKRQTIGSAFCLIRHDSMVARSDASTILFICISSTISTQLSSFSMLWIIAYLA